MKIRQVADESFHADGGMVRRADGWTDRQTDMKKLIVALFAICKRTYNLAFGFQERCLLKTFRNFITQYRRHCQRV